MGLAKVFTAPKTSFTKIGVLTHPKEKWEHFTEETPRSQKKNVQAGTAMS